MRDKTADDLNRHAVAAASLVAALNEDDETLNHDMIEGETDFFEAIEAALEEIGECEIKVAGIADMVKRLTDRSNRANKRAEKLRGLIDQAMQMADVKSHAFPTATISTKLLPAKVIIHEEADIPASFFEPQPPKLNKAELLKALKDGPVAGASLSNGGTTIQIRRG